MTHILAFQLADLAAKAEPDKMVAILQKMWKKMSPVAREQARKLPFSETEKRLVERALAGPLGFGTESQFNPKLVRALLELNLLFQVKQQLYLGTKVGHRSNDRLSSILQTSNYATELRFPRC